MKEFWRDPDTINLGWYNKELDVKCQCGATFAKHGFPELDENGLAYCVCPNDKTVFHPTLAIERVPLEVIRARRFNKNLRNLL